MIKLTSNIALLFVNLDFVSLVFPLVLLHGLPLHDQGVFKVNSIAAEV